MAALVLDSIAGALRPIPYWVGFKREKYSGHHLPEGAIVAELRETLLLNAQAGWRVLCEEQYSRILPGQETSKDRADVVIRDGKNGPYLAVIEVKRGATIDGRAREDLKSLALIRSTDDSIRAFFVQVTEAGRPKQGLTEAGKADKSIRQPVLGRKIRVRGAYRAVSHKGSKNPDGAVEIPVTAKSQHWAVLYEVE
jgi:hypothetical protein